MPETLFSRLAAAVGELPTIDIHSHIRWRQPSASHLADLMFYHYIATELETTGVDRALWADDIAPDQRIANVMPYWPRIENTATHWGFTLICRELFGLEAPVLTESNFRDVSTAASQRMASPGWSKGLLRDRLRIEKTALTIEFDESPEGYDPELFMPTLRIDPWLLGLADPKTYERTGRAAGREIGSLADLVGAIETIVDTFKSAGAVAIATSLPPEFSVGAPDRQAAANALAGVLGGADVLPDEVDDLQAFVFHEIGRLCADHGLVFQVMLGVIRGVYKDRDALATDLDALRRLTPVLRAHPNCRFDVALLSPLLSHEMHVLAKILPNVCFSGHWWYTFYPSIIKRMLTERLEIMPVGKANGFFSDSYYAEWSVAKLALFKKMLTQVLADKVGDGFLTEDGALRVAKRLLYDNPREIYQLGD